jgi:glycosyltransferase involved in cell wall biosynthesis
LISIIIPSYNKEKFIAQAIDSVLAQTFKEWELIIVDDCSTDKTKEILKAYITNQKIFIYSNDINKGGNYCRNFGLSKATQPYIIFFDADDLLLENCIENRLKLMKEYPNLDFAVFTMGIFNKKIGDNNYKWLPETKQPLNNFLQHKLPWQTMQPIYKKKIVEDNNGFDESFTRLQDVEFHTRILLNENLTYKLINSKPDCYLRIDVARKNFGSFQFMEKWVDSTIKYIHKFNSLVAESQKKYLLGTVYHTYFQLLFAHKNKEITKNEFYQLEEKLLNPNGVIKLTHLKKIYFSLLKYNNLGSLKLKGFNYLVNKLIIYF